jgi:hypothetical protein
MGVLGDMARKAMGWQKDQALADAINEETAKKKKRIAETKARIAQIKDPRNLTAKLRNQTRGALNESEMKQMGIGQEDM